MTLQVILAQVGAGKTEAVQERIISLKRANPLARVWVLLAGERQIAAFRQRLLARQPERGGYFNVEFFNFYNLYRHLLATAGRSQHSLSDAARYGLIRAVCAGEALQVYGRIAHTAGFVRIMADFIYELKQNLITPDMLAAAAGSAKELELAQLYNAYQHLLQQSSLMDREGEGWLALDALQALPHLAADVDLLIVDGYDQFNVLQAQLLALLGARVGESLVTLTTVPGREATIGRRFMRARERLQSVHAALGLPMTETEKAGHADTRHPALQHLSEHIFLPRAPVYGNGGSEQPEQLGLWGMPDNVEARRDAPSPNRKSRKKTAHESLATTLSSLAENPDAIRFIEAADTSREVGAVLRRVKALLLAGERPDDILIALRDWTGYGGYFAAQGRTYGVPLALHYGEPLAQNPAVAALMSVLELHTTDFRRRELLDVLRSPYFSVPGMPEGGADLLDRLSMAMMVTGGRSAWLEALDAAQTPKVSAADEEDEAAAFNADLAYETRLALAAFFDAVTPPQRGSTGDYVVWLDGLIGRDAPDPDDDDADLMAAYTLNLPAHIRATAAPGIVERDLVALNEFVAGLRGMLTAAALFESLGYAERGTWGDFIGELRTIIAGAAVHRSGGREGRVLVTTVTDARGLPHKHLFIVGLSEGVFPAPVPEDPLLLDTERQHLRAQGVELSTQAERADDDGLFYELTNQAHETLTLSRPYTKDGSPWPESHLWRAVRALFPHLAVHRLKVGGVVPADEVATPQEAALAIADGAESLRGWLASAHPDYWQRIAHGRTVEMSRMSRQPTDQYGGRLHGEALIAHAAAVLSPDRLWSATQLSEYGICGFRFFSRRMLRLEALKEPEDGMDILQLGTLNHEILEATYRELAEAGVTITPEYADLALETLRQQAAALFADAPRRLGFRASALWEQERAALLRRLEALVKDDFSGKSPIDRVFSGEPRRPYLFEVPFGKDDGFAIELEGEWLRVTGKIDRVDWQGSRTVVIDYKSGSTKIPTDEIRRGRNFQMMVYLLVAEAALGADEVGGVFWHLTDRKTGGALLNSDSSDQETIERAKGHIERYLARGRAGDFSTQANRLDDGRCAHHCDYHQMCRMAITARRKRET